MPAPKVDFVAAASTYNNAVSATTTLSLPAGLTTGDTLVAAFASSDTVSGAAITTPPAGWTPLRGHTTVGTMSTVLYAKTYAPGDVNVAVVLAAARKVQAGVTAYRNSSIPSAERIVEATRQVTSGTTTAPAPVALNAGNRIIRVFWEKSSTATNINVTTEHTGPGGAATRIASLGTGASATSLYIGDHTWPGGAATATYDATSGNGAAATITMLAAAPTQKLEIAFATPPATPPNSATWVDVTPQTDFETGISVTRGRGDENSAIQPSQLTVNLDNVDGRFTPGNTASPHYPNVAPGRLLRWTVAGSQRFTGYIADWTMDWAQDGAYKTVTVTANDALKRLGQTAQLLSPAEEEIFVDSPEFFMPCTDAPDAGVAVDISKNNLTPTRVIDTFNSVSVYTQPGRLEFASIDGPPGLGKPVLSMHPSDGDLDFPSSAANSKYLALDPKINTPLQYGPTSANPVTIECWVLLQRDWNNVNQLIMFNGRFGMKIDVSWQNLADYLRCTVGDQNPTPTSTVTVDTGYEVRNGEWVHLAVVAKPGSAVRFFVNGRVHTGGTCPTFGAAQYYASPNLGYYVDGGVCLYAGYSRELTDADILRHYNSGTNGTRGQRTDERVSDILRWRSIPASQQTLDKGLTQTVYLSPTGSGAVSALADAASAEEGLFYIDGTGNHVFKSRGRKYNVPAATQVAGEIFDTLTYNYDDQNLANRIRIDPKDRLPVVVQNSASITALGLYETEVSMSLLGATESIARATLRVLRDANPRVRVSEISVNLLNQADALQNLLALDLGDTISLTGLSSTAPDTSGSTIQGIKHTYSRGEHTLRFNVSPNPLGVLTHWILGTSVLDNDTIPAL